MPQFSLRRLVWAGPLVIALAVAANLLFYSISQVFGERYIAALGGPGQPAVPMPVAFIVIPTVGAEAGEILLFALLVKFSRAPLPPFLSVSAMALLISFGAPFSLTGTATLATKLLLAGMQLLTGVVIVIGILIFTRRRG